MTEEPDSRGESGLDDDGFLKVMTDWNRSMVQELAAKHDIGPLSDDHWKVIEYVKGYYETYGTGPPVVKIGKRTGLHHKEICRLFPCGTVKGAYRLAGLPRPPGCAG